MFETGDEQSGLGYPTPAFSPQPLSAVDNDDGATAAPSPTPQCSVRGCSNPVEAPNPHVLGIMKMCAACREKHRSYASAKRARRKAEKSLLTRMGLAQPQDAESAVILPSLDPAPPTPTPTPQTPQTPQFAIDPVLFSQPISNSLSGALGTTTNVPVAPTLSAQSDTAAPSNEVSDLPFVSSDHPRFCSVKGCKSVIAETIEEYPFKMCQPCRDRYRGYGITKRAKWKAEREAYDRELEGLREKEDLRRAADGLPPLAESEEDLRTWELSLVGHDGQSSLSVASGSLDPFPPKTPSHVVLPARICTVSHCHKILPGSYRYKHCEAHRIQNRRHGRLKRGRDKIEKGFMLPDGTPLITPGPIKFKPAVEQTSGEEDATTTEPGLEGAPSESVEAGEDSRTDENENSSEKKTSRRYKGSPHTCAQEACCNLILPGVRWRTCEICRATIRAERQEKAAAATSTPSAGSTTPVDVFPPENNSHYGAFNSREITSPSIFVPANIATAPATSAPTPTTEPAPAPSASAPPVRKYRRYMYSKLPQYADPDTASTSSAATASTQPPAPPPSYPFGPYPYPYMPPPGFYAPPPSSSSAAPTSAAIPPPYPYPYPYPIPPPVAGATVAERERAGWPFPYAYYPYPYPPPPGYPSPYPYPANRGGEDTAGRPAPSAPSAVDTPSVPRAVEQPAPPPILTTLPAPTAPVIPNHKRTDLVYYHYRMNVEGDTDLTRFKEPLPPRKRMRAGEGVFKVSPVPVDENGTVPPGPVESEPEPAPMAVDVAVSEPQPHAVAEPHPLPPPPQLESTPMVVDGPITQPEPYAVAEPHSLPPPPSPPEPECAPMVVDTAITEPQPHAEPQPSLPLPTEQQPRTCGSKSCNRPLLSIRAAAADGVSLPLCEKCSSKTKKKLALKKQRFKLEPRKAITAVTMSV